MRDNSHYLVAAQKQKHEELTEQVRNAIRVLDRQGEPVTFASVVRTSGVSRSFLNKIPELAGEIRSLREAQRHNPRPQPSGQRMSDASKDARISQLSEGNRKLREEVAWLKEQNAALLGKLRRVNDDLSRRGAIRTAVDDGSDQEPARRAETPRTLSSRRRRNPGG